MATDFTTITEVNVPLLEKTLGMIESLVRAGQVLGDDDSLVPKDATKNAWMQGDWRAMIEIPDGPEETECGTVMCYAGWSGQIAGVTWASDNPRDYGYQSVLLNENEVWAALKKNQGYVAKDDQGRPVMHISQYAERLLGLDYSTAPEANYLFEATNDLDMLREYVQRIIAKATPTTAVRA